MTKVLSVLLLFVMALHIWRPLGLPGLRRRADAWKIAAFAFVVFGLTILIRPE
ncbi:hypothetical protein [Antarcticirhabdus aurantiaca]|uniref:Uncharacterized protein n=1 Tax=Antarcticirhabdus aurantiaca TaxID=2606717 RepID=A0ACD4NKE7_9HYPH|nr:hypothetical protein [Antarcticirhabdus aurantiaca]WAJ27227.1 hypothetical protein OXU80_20575 [Jeongeuplla avenae]